MGPNQQQMNFKQLDNFGLFSKQTGHSDGKSTKIQVEPFFDLLIATFV
jgi:hypothetical protein